MTQGNESIVQSSHYSFDLLSEPASVTSGAMEMNGFGSGKRARPCL